MTHPPTPPATLADAAGTRRAPRFLARHGWVAVLLVGVGLTVAVDRTLVATQNPNFVPTVILLGATVVPAAFLAFIRGRRLPYDLPTTTVLVAALLGGVIGTVAAGTLEYDARAALGTLPMLAVGLIEETCKLLVPAAALLLHRRYTAADGLLLGVAVGAGFAALETMGYAFTTLLNSHDNLADTLDVLVLRGVLSPAGHMAWTGILTAALYSAAASGWTGRRVAAVGAAFVVAVGLHTAWDSMTSLVGMAVVAVVSLTALGWTAHLAGDRHRHRRAHGGATPPR